MESHLKKGLPVTQHYSVTTPLFSMQCHYYTCSRVASCLASIWFLACCCAAFEIRSPPPLQDGKAIVASAGNCKGSLRGWQWDKCALNDGIVWTALAFGHTNISGKPAPRTLGQHIQYSPFTCQQPYIGSFDQDDELHLPPMVLAVYIESETSLSFVWKPVLRFFFDEDNFGNPHEIIHHLSLNSFSCQRGDPVTVRDGFLNLGANTEYVVDNLLMSVTKSWLLKGRRPSSGCLLLNIDVRLEPFSEPEAVFDTIGSVSWISTITLAFGRNATSPSRDKLLRSQKRHDANLVSHKMCSSSINFSRRSSQRFNANTKTLSADFENSAGNMSMIFLSASVTHNREQRAVAEFLVWTEWDEGRCEEILPDGYHCASTAVSFLNLSCSAHGIKVPAHIETYSVEFYDVTTVTLYQERVVSCVFNSSSFSHSDNAVDIYIHDFSTNLEAVIPMCSLQRDRPIRKIVACSQPIYNARFMENRWPGVLQAWVLYNVARPLCQHENAVITCTTVTLY